VARSSCLGMGHKGNTTLKNAGGSLTTYTYSPENKNIGIMYPNSAVNTFSYDGDGKRLQKEDSGGTLRYVYDNQGPTGLYDLVEEMNDEDTLQAFYTQGPMLLAMRRGGASYFYHDDAIGSTSAISDSDETATSTYKYYAFGELRTSTGTLTNPFKYVGGLGYYDDPDSALLLLRARYYWPTVGRFVTRDRVQQGISWYTYAGGVPTQTVDPSGMWGNVWHRRKTHDWALDPKVQELRQTLGRSYNECTATIVAKGSYDMDSFFRSTMVFWNWPNHLDWIGMPIPDPLSAYGWSFLPDYRYIKGVRWERVSQHYHRAVEVANTSGCTWEAYHELGLALHVAQDMEAHGPASPAEHMHFGNIFNLGDAIDNPEYDVIRTGPDPTSDWAHVWRMPFVPGNVEALPLIPVFRYWICRTFSWYWVGETSNPRVTQTKNMSIGFLRRFIRDTRCGDRLDP